MPRLLHILAAFRAGRIDQAQLQARIRSLICAPGVDVARLIEALQIEQGKVPLPTETFSTVLRQLRSATDRTLLRSRELAVSPIIDGASHPSQPAAAQRLNRFETSAPLTPPATGVAKFTRTLLGRFGLIELVGEGGTSSVFKAVDLRRREAGSEDSHVAVKLLNVPFDEVSDAMALLHREMRNLQGLVHPNIVRVFDCDRDGDTVFMTMEYLAGSTLKDSMRETGLVDADGTQAFRVIESIARALEFAHGKGVVHGDLKPGNVMITASGEVKVIDFGIARMIADPAKAFARPDSGAAVHVTGVTPAYASPQMLENRGPDPRDDVYSLACIACELMTGSHPFQRKDAVVAREGGLKLETDSRLTSREYRALARALQFDREKRTSSAHQFIDELTGARGRRNVRIAASAALVIGSAAAAFVYLPRPRVAPVPPQPTVVVAESPEPPRLELSVGAVFRDCPTCPLMIVLPPGDFTRGADAPAEPFEAPQHQVFIENSFAASQHEVTAGEFAQFAEATARAMNGCWRYDGSWRLDADVSWKDAAEGQTSLHPASCVSWEDATAFALWLSQRTGQRYRLPSAAEWEFAARAGSAAERPWSSDSVACSGANVADETAQQRYPGWTTHPCTDTYVQAAPVGSFAANAFGLYDTLGNVFEWVADCWHDDYVGAPSGASARLDGDCSQHELRGGSWFTAPAFVRVSYRNRFPANYRSTSVGFRVVRDIVR
jgi:formylglycine-generating enzyme required for sulfatase activity